MAQATETATRAAYQPMTGPEVGATVAELMATSWDLRQLVNLLRHSLVEQADAGQLRLDAVGQAKWATPTEAAEEASRVLADAIAAIELLSRHLADANEIASTLGQTWTDDDLTRDAEEDDR